MKILHRDEQDKYNCFDLTVLAAANHFNIPADLFFINHFNFNDFSRRLDKINFNTEAAWFSMFSPWEKAYTASLSDFCRMKCTAVFSKEPEYIQECIQKSFSELKAPVGILMDSFLLPWNTLYHSLHRLHSFLIFAEDKDSFICYDPFMCSSYTYFPKKELLAQVTNIYLFEKLDKPKNSKYEALLQVAEWASEAIVSRQEDLSNFAQSLLTITPETKSAAFVEQSSLLLCMANMEWSRKNFSLAISCLADGIDKTIYKQLRELLTESEALWKKARQSLIKSFFAPNKERCIKRGSDTIVDISKIEPEILSNLIKIRQ
jgi:hypothetical protein